MEWADLAATAGATRASWAEALAEAVPTLVDLGTIGQDAPTAVPVLCHNALGPGNVRHGTNGRLIVVGWEYAGGQPPSWELADALRQWTIDPGGGVNAAGARAMLDGYRSAAGSLPRLDLAAFRGTATSLANYVSGEIDQALTARDCGDADRSVHHLLSHLPPRALLEQLLEVAVGAAHT